MFDVAAKAGYGLIFMLALLGVIEAQQVGHAMMLFVTVGLIPGTNVELPAEFVLLGVGAMLMVLTVLFCRSYVANHSALDRVLPDFPHSGQEDPALESLVPGLATTKAAGQSARSAVNDVAVELYFWLRSFGQPVIAQAIHARRGLTSTLVRFDRLAAMRTNLEQNIETLYGQAREWADKAYTYFVRLTTR